MKRCSLLLPDKMAIYLKDKKLSTKTQMLSCALMLYPLAEDGTLTYSQIASLMGLEETDIRRIYARYDLPDTENCSANHYAKEREYLEDYQRRLRSVV
jgi:hypothetical protein